MEQVERNPAKAIQKLLFEAMKREDDVLNELAAEALTSIGTDVVYTLVLEALTSRQTGYRLRLLRIIENVGEITDPAAYLDLMALARDDDPKIREAAVRTVHALGPHRARRLAGPQEPLCHAR